MIEHQIIKLEINFLQISLTIMNLELKAHKCIHSFVVVLWMRVFDFNKSDANISLF